MNNFFFSDFRNIVITIIDLVGVFLAFWVYASNPKEKTTRGFLFMVFSILSWITFYHFASMQKYEGSSLLLFRFANGSVFLFFISYYFFIVRWFLEKEKFYKILGWLVLLYGLVFGSISVFTNLIVTSTEFKSWGGFPLFSNWGWLVFYGHVILLTILINIVLVRSYEASSQENKTKIQYFLSGLVFFAVFNFIFNVILPIFWGNYKYYYFGNYSTIVLLILTAYAIVKHQLFNIKVIATESVVVVLSIGLLIEVFVSNNTAETVIKAIIWILATYGGWQLIKSVKVEIKQREDLAVLAKQLEDANSHLKEIDKLKDDFLSMASHELNTPIAAIEGYLSMILQEGMGGKIPPKAKEYLESVFKSSQRLANLVKDLLNVSRIESGRIHIIYEQKQITDIIDQSIMEVMSKAREAKHTLTFEKPAKMPPLTYFDVTRVTEILINMLGNSIKYTPPGGTIIVRVVNDDKKIVVSVADNGKGIPKERTQAVFEKFTQVDVMKDEVKGTGLGMYIAKKFIELMNGQIWFQSPGVNKGTTFFFSLPVLKEKPVDPHEGEGEVLH